MAIVYIRQSSVQQVIHHEESQRRQRGFVQRAAELGWPADRIRVLDEDLGKSGSRSAERGGFEQMVAMVALGKIGIILALEVSRLARSNRDWYHLLDVCSICATLIGDEEGLYNPALYNDRLLLGLKGTMSEAELHLIKQRLVEAMRAKAKRGELRRRLPAVGSLFLVREKRGNCRGTVTGESRRKDGRSGTASCIPQDRTRPPNQHSTYTRHFRARL